MMRSLQARWMAGDIAVAGHDSAAVVAGWSSAVPHAPLHIASLATQPGHDMQVLGTRSSRGTALTGPPF